MIEGRRGLAECPRSWETSLIFEPSPEVVARVLAFRTHPRLAAYTKELSRPHVTALFVGHLSDSKVRSLELALALPPHQTIEAGLLGWGRFARSDGTVNLHIRVEPVTELLAVHQWALQVCRKHDWTPPADTSAKNYMPHITVADGPLDPSSVMHDLGNASVPPHVTLLNLQFRAYLSLSSV
jgi:2'-5' RNA ligase